MREGKVKIKNKTKNLFIDKRKKKVQLALMQKQITGLRQFHTKSLNITDDFYFTGWYKWKFLEEFLLILLLYDSASKIHR